MPSIRGEILTVLDRVRGELAENDLELATKLLTRYAELSTLRIGGEDVDVDLAVVLASLSNIRAGVYGSIAAEVRAVVMDWVTSILASLVGIGR